MNTHTVKPLLAGETLPPDDLSRSLSLVDPDDPALSHLAIVGDTYTVLLAGEQTDGRYCLIDMAVPKCGGPGPHRHDFEEMFHLLEGEIEFTFRGEKTVLRKGMTVNIPANAPHFFTNLKEGGARMLCMCTPAGQEQFFEAIATPVDSRTAPAPAMGEEAQAQFIQKAQAAAPQFRTELLAP